jgi:hypothetical protein
LETGFNESIETAGKCKSEKHTWPCGCGTCSNAISLDECEEAISHVIKLIKNNLEMWI